MNKLTKKENIIQDFISISLIIGAVVGVIYKMERKTHPSFLRGWDVSDKDSELTL